MELDELAIDDQVAAFTAMIGRNRVIAEILERLGALGLPDCWLVAGGLFQTVWNVLSGRDPRAGIRDYDINYFDDSDLSWEAEDAVIAAAATVFDGIDGEVEVRNEARVHLWYEAKFGVPCPPYRSTRHAISTFPSCSACVGVRPRDGALEVFAPFGLTDLFRMTTRPNPALAPRSIYETKAARWAAEWPALTVLPWPGVGLPGSGG